MRDEGDEDQFDRDRKPTPWFGPKRFGIGSRPQSWQGFLVVALMVAAAAVIATLTKDHHSPLMGLIAVPVLVIVLLQGRR